jgi:hypothetical protein
MLPPRIHSCMYADQEQPRNKMGKKYERRYSLCERDYKIYRLINQAKHHQKT